jgi:hypothetical protein
LLWPIVAGGASPPINRLSINGSSPPGAAHTAVFHKANRGPRSPPQVRRIPWAIAVIGLVVPLIVSGFVIWPAVLFWTAILASLRAFGWMVGPPAFVRMGCAFFSLRNTAASCTVSSPHRSLVSTHARRWSAIVIVIVSCIRGD